MLPWIFEYRVESLKVIEIWKMWSNHIESESRQSSRVNLFQHEKKPSIKIEISKIIHRIASLWHQTNIKVVVRIVGEMKILFLIFVTQAISDSNENKIYYNFCALWWSMIVEILSKVKFINLTLHDDARESPRWEWNIETYVNCAATESYTNREISRKILRFTEFRRSLYEI